MDLTEYIEIKEELYNKIFSQIDDEAYKNKMYREAKSLFRNLSKTGEFGLDKWGHYKWNR